MEYQIAERWMRENDRWGGSLKHKGHIDEDVEFYTLHAVQSRVISSPLLESIAGEMVSNVGKGNRGKKSLKEAILCLINACFEAIHNQYEERMVGVLWSTSTSSQLNNRYKGPSVSPSNRKPAVELLEAAEYVRFYKGSKDGASFVPGRVSLVMPSEKMEELYLDVVSQDDFKVYELDDTIKEVVILRGADGKDMDYADNEFTICQRKILRSITTINQAAQWSYEADDGRTHSVTASSFVLSRLFKEGSFRSYGRMHCEAQGLRKAYRERLRIDGEPTSYLDFKSMSAVLAYVHVGLERDLEPYVLEGDAYDIQGFTREQAKLAFQICMNTKTREAALLALYSKMSVKEAERLIWKIERKHYLIKQDFYQNLWMEKLTIIESDIMAQVLEHCAAWKTPVLPIHDGIVCKASERDRVFRVMSHTFELKCEVTPTIVASDQNARPLPETKTTFAERQSA